MSGALFICLCLPIYVLCVFMLVVTLCMRGGFHMCTEVIACVLMVRM